MSILWDISPYKSKYSFLRNARAFLGSKDFFLCLSPLLRASRMSCSSFSEATVGTLATGLRSKRTGWRVDAVAAEVYNGNMYVFTQSTLKSLIEEHARLDFSDFLPTLLAIFPPARLLFYLVKWKIPPCSFINLLSK